MKALAIAVLLSTTIAHADDGLGREMCTRSSTRSTTRSTTSYRGATRDFDVKDADIRDVFRLLADTGKINIVVADDVSGRVTMRLKNVPWDQILCTVAAVHKLRVTIDKSIVMVTRKSTK